MNYYQFPTPQRVQLPTPILPSGASAISKPTPEIQSNSVTPNNISLFTNTLTSTTATNNNNNNTNNSNNITSSSGNYNMYLPPFYSLSIDLPLMEYKLAKTVMIPFDPTASNDAKFLCLADALKFIYKHCMANHGFCTRQLAKKYLQFVRILNGPTGMFIVMTNFGKKEFDQVFNKIRQSMETHILT